ncbi:hypothetical protein [Streptomonospora salina]|uniref:Uncharacterized protein n=1 Tax=Streptomonospora salina TaxID=104205 RepID=A0A841ECK2_9ACTN|nr:hypothetical protein [Streptomonospora salina]MBB6000875.1 hypothetical protein [Streptomonospora salina]
MHLLSCEDCGVLPESSLRNRPVDRGGPDRHHAAITGRLGEWSYEALGWVAAYVAEAAAQHGVRTPVLLTIRRL